MTASLLNPPTATVAEPAVAEPVVAVRRRTVDRVLIGLGALAVVILAVAGGLLTWAHNFADDYVQRELSSQNIFFPSADELTTEGRTDLVRWADEQVTTGSEAEAYASFINGHLQGVADGATYADLGATRARRARRWPTPRTTAPAPARSPRCRPISTPSADSATRCSRARPSAASCCRATPGRRLARSPASPPSPPSSRRP